MAIITTGNNFGATAAVTSTTLNNIANAATFDDPVDGTSLELKVDGKLGIKDDAITPALIADDAVTTPAILDANVTFAKLTDVIDSDTMTGASATTLATSESIKAYVDGGFTPSTYNGEGSVTLPNKLVMKWGLHTATTGNNSINFGTAFDTQCINIQYSRQRSSSSLYDDNGCVVGTPTTTGFVVFVVTGSSYGNIYWTAIGY